MKRTNFAIAAVSVALVSAVAWWEFARLTGPGDLHPSHARLTELRGSGGCVKCHGEPSGRSMSEACLACHQQIHEHIAGQLGLHGNANEARIERCQDCHVEHSGAAVALVSQSSFKLSGVPDLNDYAHDHISTFALEGRHHEIDCAECHRFARAESLRAGEQRYLGLSQQCSGCHEDVHQGRFGEDCAACHGQRQPFEVVAEFEHTESFPLVESHSGLSCQSCHQDGSPHALSSLTVKTTVRVRTCFDCHASPHTQQFVSEIARLEQVAQPQTCALCHKVGHKTFLYPDAGMTRQQHAATGFELVAPHDTQECTACHAQMGRRQPAQKNQDVSVQFASFFPGRAIDECRACHGDPHNGQFDSVNQPAQCIACHDRAHFVPSVFDATRHAQTAFAIVGAHEKVDCSSCHARIDGITRYAGTPTECAACHEDPHAGQFADLVSDNDCSACHGVERFAPTRFDFEDHGRTRFPLRGAHEAVGCRLCHKEQRNGVRQFVGTSMDCAGCHADVHRGAFDGPNYPKVVDGKTGCARCHTESSFSDVSWDDDTHARWTGYALVGAHAKAACTDCHRRDGARSGALTSFAPASPQCASCHADPHAGQFTVNGITDCARCHTELNPFKQATFDHQRDSRFQLDETHRTVSCAQCHKPFTVANATVIRYKPLGRECQDCHGFGFKEK